MLVVSVACWCVKWSVQLRGLTIRGLIVLAFIIALYEWMLDFAADTDLEQSCNVRHKTSIANINIYYFVDQFSYS